MSMQLGADKGIRAIAAHAAANGEVRVHVISPSSPGTVFRPNTVADAVNVSASRINESSYGLSNLL